MTFSYKPDGILNMYQNIKPKTVIPYSLITHFLALQLLGVDHGFGRTLKPGLRPMAKCATILNSIIIVGVPLVTEIIEFDRYNLIIVLHYLINISILHTSKYTLCDMIVDINGIVGSKGTSRERFGIIVLVYGIVFSTVKLLSHIMHCAVAGNATICSYGWMTYFIFATILLSIELMPLAFIVMFCHIYYAVKHLNAMAVNPIPKKYYVSVMNSYSNILPLYDKLITVELLFEIPRMLALLWKILVLIKEQAGWSEYVSESVNTFFIALQICLPAIVAEMVNHELEALKLKLLNSLVTEEDDQNNDDIKVLIQYVQNRLEHKSWRIIPMDLRLPISLANFCTVYFIAIIQFTHLYD